MKFLKIIKEIVLYIWQLPQNLLGLIMILIMQPENKYKLDNGNIVYFAKRMSGGISLGKYSIITDYCHRTNLDVLLNQDVVKHESIGHGIQSRILGWFYLLVIGLPSIIWAGLYGSIIPETKNGYYKWYTESWADKLAGIVRK